MTDKMREAFEKWATDRGVRDKLALETYWGMFQTMWQAAQAVPVVGEVVAWVRRHPDGALTTEFLEDAVIEPVRRKSGAWIPLHLRPTHSIATAELERLRRIEAVMIEVSNLRFNHVTLPIVREMIDAAIAAEETGNG